MPRLGKGSKSSFQMENHPPWLGFYPGIHFIKRMVLFFSWLVGWAGYHSRGIFNQCLLSSSIWHQTNRSNNRSPSGFHSHDQTACFSTQKRFHNGTWQDPFQIMSWCCPNSSLNSAIINLRQTFSDLNCVEWILDIFFSGSFNLRATFCLLSFGDSQELDRTAHARSLWFGPFQIGAGAFFLEHSVGARRPTGNFRPKLGVQLVALPEISTAGTWKSSDWKGKSYSAFHIFGFFGGVPLLEIHMSPRF